MPATLAVLPETSGLIPETGCGQRPRIVFTANVCLVCKNSKIMYRTKNKGNTIIRKEFRQRKSDDI